VKELARTAYSHGFGLIDEEELPEGWQDDAAEKLHLLEFYADRPVASAASAAYGAAWSWGVYGNYNDPKDPDFHERQQKYDDAELEMLVLMRASLSMPDVDPMLPPSGYSCSEPALGDPDEPGPDSGGPPDLQCLHPLSGPARASPWRCTCCRYPAPWS
jgi:hypothetical protein